MEKFTVFVISLCLVAFAFIFALVFRIPVIIRITPIIMCMFLVFGLIGIFISTRSPNKKEKIIYNERAKND